MSSELMDSTAEDVLHQMRGIRRQLPGDVGRVVSGARELVDWRTYVAEFPWASMASAAIMGYWLVPSSPTGEEEPQATEGATLGGTAAGRAHPGPTLSEQVLQTVGPMIVRTALNSLSQHVAATVGEVSARRREY